MKRYFDYLSENTSDKKYAFKIKVAGPLPDNFEDCVETALQQYAVSRFSKGKRTPIQAKLLDFPEVVNAEVTVFEAELDYPSTSTVVAELVSSTTGVPRSHVCVRTPVEEENWDIEHANSAADPESGKQKQALLNQPYEKSERLLVGDAGVATFLKSLAAVKREAEQIKGVNDQLLAKKAPKEAANQMPKPGPARSLFASKKEQK